MSSKDLCNLLRCDAMYLGRGVLIASIRVHK